MSPGARIENKSLRKINHESSHKAGLDYLKIRVHRLPSFFLSGAIPVQKGFKSIESIEIETHISGGILANNPRIWGVDLNFESVGCAFESHRECLYVGVFSFPKNRLTAKG